MRLSIMELGVVLLVIVFFFAPKQLPKLSKAWKDFQTEIENNKGDAGLSDSASTNSTAD